MPRRGWVSSRYLSTERDDKVNLFYTKSDVAYMAQEVRQSLITTGIIYMLLGLVIGVTNMRDYYGYNLLIWGGALLSVIDVVFLISSNTNPFVSFGILSVSSAYALILPVMLLLLSNFRITPFEICVGFTKTITIFGFTVFPLHLIDFLFPIRPFVQTIIAEVTG